ncbi:unnamed protein product [Brachionus calyciflorus]|uniref:Uncharacterized protein n=1 Tax=Brachionus calyciflorus TaxID=104777 RepID=A0A813UHP5_9BILA|nr:unnamed protein product [Brachionus calyciflorus]
MIDIESDQTFSDDEDVILPSRKEKEFTKLFFDKWGLNENVDLKLDDLHDDLTKFLKYFKKEWIVSKHCNRYEGAALSYPSTNNGLESTNKPIKDNHTVREREHVSRFIKSVFEIIKIWSIDRSSETDKIKKFYDMPEFTTGLWDATDEFIASKPKIKYIKDHDLYLVADVETCDESFELVFEMLDCEVSGCQCFIEHYDFDQFILVNREIKRVYVNKSKLEFSTCQYRLFV